MHNHAALELLKIITVLLVIYAGKVLKLFLIYVYFCRPLQQTTENSLRDQS